MGNVVAWFGRFARRSVAMIVTALVVAPIAEATLPEPLWMIVAVAAILAARLLA